MEIHLLTILKPTIPYNNKIKNFLPSIQNSEILLLNIALFLLFFLFNITHPGKTFKMSIFNSKSSISSTGFLTTLCFLMVRFHIASSALPRSLNHHHKTPHHHTGKPIYQNNGTSCALFSGTWVRDDSYPLYQYSECPIIDSQFNCQLYGRPDSEYLKYRWRPLNCELPRFNGIEFLYKMRGKTVMFVGDSLGRNQWQSLICMVLAVAPTTPTKMVEGDPLTTFEFLDHKVSISYYKAPYLVDIDVVHGKRILKLEDINGNGNAWRSVDVLSFNTGHWWSHKGDLQGWDYMEAGGKYYQDMDRVVALEKGLNTWANWVDAYIDTTTTSVFFASISPTHYDPSEWNSGGTSTSSSGNCYGETTPVPKTTYGTRYPDVTRVINSVIRDMLIPTYLLDITMLSKLRKDCHPSIYNGDLSPGQKANPDRSADCSHWCLPGLPDTWNELFYTALLF